MTCFLREIWTKVRSFEYPYLLDERVQSLVQKMKEKDEALTYVRSTLSTNEVALIEENHELESSRKIIKGFGVVSYQGSQRLEGRSGRSSGDTSGKP